MTFLDSIYDRLQHAGDAVVLQEIHASGMVGCTGSELLALIDQARTFLQGLGMAKGHRCAILAPNSIRWAALDIAMMTEGIITVPLYARQAPAELCGMIKDCTPVRICCGDEALRQELTAACSDLPPVSIFSDIFKPAASNAAPGTHAPHAPFDAVTIIYTSGTSGEPKGVVLTSGNVTHMLSCTNARLDQLMRKHGPASAPDRVFHYAPFCFAASWILLLTCLTRNSVLSLSMDLTRLADEMKIAAPDYFLNVPALLERVRRKVEEQVQKSGRLAIFMFMKGRAAYLRKQEDALHGFDLLWLGLANRLVFRAIRKSLGPNLKALICGSAPLNVETQLFFMMIGIPVLQAYGLTETTAICTLDDPADVTPGRVGKTIPGIEMTLGEGDEILVRGPNVFPGYWQRPEATAKALAGGWFHTGDQGEVDKDGKWKIVGRLKNLLILNSGHNIAPEPIEDALQQLLPAAQQVVLVGNNQSYLAAILTLENSGGLVREQVEVAIDQLNRNQPHYKQVRAFYIHGQPFTIESGLLTANGKLKRELIAAHLAAPIRNMYSKKTA